MTPITLVKVVETCAGAPSQWDAWDANGQYYYMRFRHGGGTVHAEPGPDERTWTTFPTQLGTPMSVGSVADFRRSHDVADSFMTLTEFLERAGLQLAPDAVVTTPHEEHDMATAAEAAPAAAPAPPTPKSEGTYALFDLPDGGLLLAYRDKAEPDVDKRIPIPAFIVRMAEKAAAGEGITPGMIGQLFGGAR